MILATFFAARLRRWKEIRSESERPLTGEHGAFPAPAARAAGVKPVTDQCQNHDSPGDAGIDLPLCSLRVP
ncbi:unnamed protein product [Lampetra planeri]